LVYLREPVFAQPCGLGPVAQLVEQGTFNPKVAGSIPARPIRKGLQPCAFLRYGEHDRGQSVFYVRTE
jgi:hypothetical protein